MYTITDPLWKATHAGNEYRIWYDQESAVLWLMCYRGGYKDRPDHWVRADVYGPTIEAKYASDVRRYLNEWIVPQFNKAIETFAGSGGPLPPVEFPEDKLLEALFNLVRTSLAFDPVTGRLMVR